MEHFRFFAPLEIPAHHFRPCVDRKETKTKHSSVNTSSLSYPFSMPERPDQNISLLSNYERCILLVNYPTPNVLLSPRLCNSYIKFIICLNLRLEKLDAVTNMHRNMYKCCPELYKCTVVWQINY
jgi:hypothetical protein